VLFKIFERNQFVVMKRILFLFLIPCFCFGQNIIEEVDEFTGERKTVFNSLRKNKQPIIVVERPGQAIPIKEIKDSNNQIIMTITINGNHFFNDESELWVLFENGEKHIFDIELYGKLIQSPNYYSDSYTSAYYSYLDFTISENFIDDMSNGRQIKTFRLFTTDGYINYKNSGWLGAKKEKRRQEGLKTWFTNIKNYLISRQ